MDYQKIYNALISFRLMNPLKKSKEFYTEIHHIIPSCLGGSDDPSNLLRLTGREHFVAHRLLAKIHPNCRGLILAVFQMSNRMHESRISSSREFSRIREIASALSTAGAIKQWSTPEIRSQMIKGRAEACVKSWKDPVVRSQRIESLTKGQRKRFENIKSRQQLSEAQRKRYERYPEPWKQSRSQPTKHIWTLAASLWILRNTPDHPVYSARRFSKEFCSGRFVDIFDSMIQRFNMGWVPQDCESYKEEFGFKM